MARWTKAERDKLPESDFGDPSSRLFPIDSQEDVDSAAHLIGKAKNPDAVKKRIIAIAKRKGLKVPEAWEKAGMSELYTADFALAADPVTSGKTVTRTAPVVFRAGDYDFPAEKGGTFSMTPEEVMAFCHDFRPVELEDTHVPSIFNGKLGRLVEVKPSADYSEFGGRVEIPKWFDDLFAGEPIKLSAKWDRATKRMTKLAVLPNPRITDAAMFAGFAKDAADDGAVHKTPHGQKLLQFVHDHCAEHGAVCKPSGAPPVAMADGYPNVPYVRGSTHDPDSPMRSNFAEFTADHEMRTIQQIHDLTLGSGAACAIYKDQKDKLPSADTQWRPGQVQKSSVKDVPLTHYRPGQVMSFSGAETPTVTQPQTPATVPGVQAAPAANSSTPPAPTSLPAEFTAQLDQLRAQLAQQQAEVAAARQQAVANQVAADMAQAAAFAKQMLVERRILPKDLSDVQNEYLQAAKDDRASGGVVAFADEQDRATSGTRVQAVVARYRRRPPHNLTQELLPGNADFSVLANPTFARESRPANPVNPDLEDARRKAEEYATKRNGRQPAKQTS